MQEEISIREIIETIWNGKWIIIVITIVAMLISGIYSYFLLSPIYEAVSTIRLGNVSVLEAGEKQHNLNTYAESVKTDTAINRIIDKLKLDRSKYSINSIRESVNVEVVKDTNVMRLKVQGNESSKITSIVNLLAFEVGARIEITDRAWEIVQSRLRLKDLDDLIIINNKELEETNNQLIENPELLVTKQSLAEEPYLQSVLENSSGITNRELGALQLWSESVNPVYSALKQRIADKTIELSVSTAEYQNIELEIAKNEARIEHLEQQLDKVKLTSLKPERLLSEFGAVFISPAIEPETPVGPNKTLNIAIAVVLGILLSFVIVFARHYWRNSSNTSDTDHGISISNYS